MTSGSDITSHKVSSTAFLNRHTIVSQNCDALAQFPEHSRRTRFHEHRSGGISGDLVVIGGPDSDPAVPRDATYVLDRPCARTYRLAHGTAWLVQNRPDLDFVMYH